MQFPAMVSRTTGKFEREVKRKNGSPPRPGSFFNSTRKSDTQKPIPARQNTCWLGFPIRYWDSPFKLLSEESRQEFLHLLPPLTLVAKEGRSSGGELKGSVYTHFVWCRGHGPSETGKLRFLILLLVELPTFLIYFAASRYLATQQPNLFVLVGFRVFNHKLNSVGASPASPG
ncbi:hypothetical protein BJ322DRAFT_1021104 [Thelephora terrestris]|uniref:Uncharacterized protein n=1 Tax=Thelephora terrestris TaxID=56493 RepID=A0A9P6HCQ3_9AGAM|nr:hypothetical protein BJ322DRAFT_1021104 [Thelephora terrestris]